MSLDLLLDSLLAAGISYGWRLDAIVLGGLLWSMAAGYGRLRPALISVRH
jgi:hypothetical protein